MTKRGGDRKKDGTECTYRTAFLKEVVEWKKHQLHYL